MDDPNLVGEISELPCVLNCKDPKMLFKFPHNEESRKAWLERLGMIILPHCITSARICNNHFSEQMFSEREKRLNSCALPDINIPRKQIGTASNENDQVNKPKPFIVETTPVEDSLVSKPKPVTANTALDKSHPVNKPQNVKKFMIKTIKIPRIGPRAEIITTPSSKCFLKCKDAKINFGFPQDRPSHDIWIRQLCMNEMPTRSSKLCQNHFSARMFTGLAGRRLTSCAIPDINLPATTVFKTEEGILQHEIHPTIITDPMEAGADDKSPDNTMNINLSQNENETTEVPHPSSDLPMIIEDTFETFGQEILINPIENIKSVVDLPSNKEGILHVFQPGVERRDNESQVILPQDVVDAESECVLKCPDGERLFRFPNAESQRQIWLKKIGLTHCFHNTKICNRHFSDRMFIKSKKRLAKLAFPDINIPAPAQPRIKDSSKDLRDYKIMVRNKHVCDMIDLPQYICVLTVLKGHTEIGAVVNGIKYLQHKVDENIPKRDREVQVDVTDLIKTANVAIPADDYVDDIDIEENVDYEQLDWINMFKSQVFASKADMYECLICGEISVGHACNVKHSYVHRESSSLCFLCGRLFTSQHQLKMHEKNEHLNQLDKALRCPKMHCKKAFHSRKQLHNHVDEHTRYTMYKCSKCFRAFSSSLKLHCHQAACRSCWSFKYPRRTRSDVKRRIK